MAKHPNRAKPAPPHTASQAGKRPAANEGAGEDLDPFAARSTPPEPSARTWHEIMGRRRDPNHRRIGERMIRAGLIEERQLSEALDIQKQTGRRTVDTLVTLGYLRPAAFCEFAAKEIGVAAIDLKNYLIPSELKGLLDPAFAEEREVAPLGRVGRMLTLAMACPFDQDTVQEVERRTGLRVCPILCEARDIRQAIHRLHPSANAFFEA